MLKKPLPHNLFYLKLIGASSTTPSHLINLQFLCLFNYHNNSSTIPVTFIVKFWSTSIEMISSDTMKEDSLNHYNDLITNSNNIYILIIMN